MIFFWSTFAAVQRFYCSAAVTMEKPPIVIAGAGLHGAALAYYLTRRFVLTSTRHMHAQATRGASAVGRRHLRELCM